MIWRALGAAALLVVVGAVAVYGIFGADVLLWGCPSQEELERLRTPGEVEAAFAETGLPLERVPWPAELRRAGVYEGAIVYRRRSSRSTLYLLVCRVRCGISRFQIRPGKPRAPPVRLHARQQRRRMGRRPEEGGE